MSDATGFVLIVMFALLFLVFTIFVGCNDPKEAIRVLTDDGYSDVQICGTNYLACGKEDWFRTCFSATKNGKAIHGTVCSGLLFKGKTIRLD